MKTNLLITLALCITMMAEAQIQKGTGFISGALYGNSNESTNTDYRGNQFDYKSRYFNLTPSYGKYISDQLR